MQQQLPPVVRQTNSLGVAGFIISVICLLFFWVPVLDIILCVLGFVFSFIALFKSPRGFAIAGFVISCINAVLMFALLGATIISIAALAAL